jgi:hypothetical protein
MWHEMSNEAFDEVSEMRAYLWRMLLVYLCLPVVCYMC